MTTSQNIRLGSCASMIKLGGGAAGAPLSYPTGKTMEAKGCAAPAEETKTSLLSSSTEMRRLKTALYCSPNSISKMPASMAVMRSSCELQLAVASGAAEAASSQLPCSAWCGGGETGIGAGQAELACQPLAEALCREGCTMRARDQAVDGLAGMFQPKTTQAGPMGGPCLRKCQFMSAQPQSDFIELACYSAALCPPVSTLGVHQTVHSLAPWS